LVLSIHISINNFEELKDFNETINYYFKEQIKIKNNIYNLSRLVLNKSINHYICLFKNNNKNLLINMMYGFYMMIVLAILLIHYQL